LYSNIIRTDEYKRRLLDFIRAEYGIAVLSLTPAKRGYFGETWRLDSAEKSYFLKLDCSELHKFIYEGSFHVVEHLREHGIGFISRIVRTADGELSTRFDGAVLGLFEWVEGDNIQDERTKIREYQMLAQIYAVPAEGLCIPREDFSCRSAGLFYAQCERLKSDPADETAVQILELFEQSRAEFARRAERLKLFSQRCQGDTSCFCITHGDAGGNVIIDGDRFTLVDWDDPALAPPERDAWFCLHWDWAMDAFHEALRQNGIGYTLRPERLAYYCYHSFFWYLTEYLATYFEIGNRGGNMCEALKGYLDGWIVEEVRFADTIC